ncbi:hypothetical protein [Lactobacillus sp. ESL0225]|nr:hypothetical protein [Lactobacillus sp. ESL0225]
MKQEKITKDSDATLLARGADGRIYMISGTVQQWKEIAGIDLLARKKVAN